MMKHCFEIALAFITPTTSMFPPSIVCLQKSHKNMSSSHKLTIMMLQILIHQLIHIQTTCAGEFITPLSLP